MNLSPFSLFRQCTKVAMVAIAAPALLLALGFASSAIAQTTGTPAGTVISNQAQLSFLNSAGGPSTELSNVVETITAVTRTPATVGLTRVLPTGVGSYQETVGPAACMQNGAFTPLPNPQLLGGVAIDPAIPQQVLDAGTFNLGEPVFIRLDDFDQNIDASVIDYAVVTVSHDTTGDTESIRLTETGLNTGIFTGYIPTAGGTGSSGDCVLQGASDSTIEVLYVDPADGTDAAQTAAVLDPVSIVFESRSGEPVDGASIAIVDAISGSPVQVFGNDGVSQFPSVITSGGTETDSSGTIYSFGAGEFRFPVVANGNYRLIVTPPATYSAPSTASATELQQLPGAPFNIDQASFGAAFAHTGTVNVNFDIPIDPRDSALFMQKVTQTSVAAIGDFVRYELTLENSAASGVASNVRIIDDLPGGVRFVPGSVTRDGQASADPIVSADLSTLDFPVGVLPAGERVSIFYVVEIVAGVSEEIVNSATAFADSGLVSNKSDARIQLREDLFRSTSTIIGRVLEGHCHAGRHAEDLGVSGIRVYLEDGRFAVSDEGGRFHFEGLQPGNHVAQLDLDTVPRYFEVVGCDTAPIFSGRSDSQFVKTSRGSLTRADFYLRRKLAPVGQVDVQMHSRGTDDANVITYELELSGEGNIRIRNIVGRVLLPDGVTYQAGTLQIDGTDRPDPEIGKQTLAIEVPEQFGNWVQTIRFNARIADDSSGEMTTKAFAEFDSPIQSSQKTPVVETRMIREPAILENEGYVLNLTFGVLSAELSPTDQQELEQLIVAWEGVGDVHIAAVGHSDSQKISAANQHVFADNYALSRARAQAAAEYLAVALGVDSRRISVVGRGPDDPVASNQSADGRAQNRRVEMVLSGRRPMRPSFVDVTKAASGVVIAETKGAVPGMEEELAAERASAASIDMTGMPSSQIEPPLSELIAGAELLLPAADFNPAIPSTKISVKHGIQQSVRVMLNGKAVNALNYDGVEVSTDQTFAVSRWKGVDLSDGANDIRVELENPDGTTDIIEHVVTYAGTAIRGEIVPELSKLVADGKTRPVVAVRLFDRLGKPSRQGAVGAFRVAAPYRSWWEVEYDRKNEIIAVGSREPIYRVGDDGVALIELEPTTEAGEAKLTLNFDNRRQQELRVWLSSQPRDWILVGFAEGTVGYNTLENNMTAAAEAGLEEGYYDEGRVAFFAKGQIKGDFLLTLAYDSDRERRDNVDQFQTVVDPNAYYSLYADQSEQRFDAPSQRKLYLKLERRQFFALFGDYDTGLSVTELARYERRFNGFKTGFRGENVSYSAFAAETSQSFLRDDIRGDGTSGLYRLSSAPIIANSEQVRIEVRDRFDSGEVLSSTTLSRFLDYSLDTLTGTLYFKQPIPSRDPEFNPVFIVIEYESQSNANEELVAGGRVSLRDTADRVELGVSHINDAAQGAESDLTGVDFRWQVSPETLLKAEIASSNRIENGVEASGDAHQVTLEHQGEKVDVRAYMKEVDEGFGLGLQNAAETGVRKVGVDARAQLSERFYFDGEAGWQQNLTTDAIRNTARAQLRFEQNTVTASAGVVHASDKFDDGTTQDSSLAELGVSKRFGDLTLRAMGSFELSNASENIDFPQKITLGTDYRILRGVDLFAEYEEARGEDFDATMTRVGVKASPWSRAQINTSVTNEASEFGPRVFANLGLIQGFQLSERWVVDVGVDQTNTLSDSSLRPFDPERELASGSRNEDFIAVFAGAAYTTDYWSANSRVEVRNSDTEERVSLLSGWYREPSMGHGLSAGLTLFSSETLLGSETTAANLRFGWAWRKADSRWSFLNRTDLIVEDIVLPTQQQDSRKLINNFNANRRMSARTQLSLQYASKYVRSTFDDQVFSGYSDLVGIDFRRGFKDRWDWGLQTSAYHSYQSDVLDYGYGLDLGFNVRDNMWLTVGYNVIGFHDADFVAARYTAQGPFLRISMKSDQRSLRAIANRRQ